MSAAVVGIFLIEGGDMVIGQLGGDDVLDDEAPITLLKPVLLRQVSSVIPIPKKGMVDGNYGVETYPVIMPSFSDLLVNTLVIHDFIAHGTAQEGDFLFDQYSEFITELDRRRVQQAEASKPKTVPLRVV